MTKSTPKSNETIDRETMRERIEESLAVSDLAGMKPDPAFCRELERVINGEITLEQLKDEILAPYKKN